MYVRRAMLGRITGIVFFDRNCNGRKDDGEEGVAGIRLFLYAMDREERGDTELFSGSVVASAVTGDEGRFVFPVLPGLYTLSADIDTLPPGMRAALPVHTAYTYAGSDLSIGLREEASPEPAGTERRTAEPDAGSKDRIDRAFESGEIDERDKVFNYLYLLFDREKLSREFRGKYREPVKSGTIMLQEIDDFVRNSRADKDAEETVRAYMATSMPQLEKQAYSPSGYFRVHYTLKGRHAVPEADSNKDGIPDYVDRAGAAFDHVKRVTCGERGFREPIIDKGEKAFNIYIYDLNGVYGMTQAISSYKSQADGIRTASGRICIDNSYGTDKGFKNSRDDSMRVTAAHEFFHAVQLAYNADADKWWKEASATWNEDEIYNSVNDYFRYIGEMLTAPEKPLDKKSYGAVVFAKYLSERLYGHEIIKRIWERQSTQTNSLAAIDSVLRARKYGQDAGRAFDGFTACNFNPSQYYAEGNQWQSAVKIKERHESYPVVQKQDRIDHLSSSYYVFKPSSKEKSGDLRITVEAYGNTRWGMKLQKKQKGGNFCEPAWISIQPGGRAEITIKRFSKTYDEVCLIPANLEKEKDGGKFSYFAELV